jgi:hypothetical protein
VVIRGEGAWLGEVMVVVGGMEVAMITGWWLLLGCEGGGLVGGHGCWR